MDYKNAGVDIEAGEKAVQGIKGLVKQTYNSNVLSELGSFGGLYRLDLTRWKEPVMVASTDGVGTKLLVAQMADRYDTIGQDLVNHCVNDIFVQGAVPQFFMDYIGVAKMDSDMIQLIISGMTKACTENQMSLLGGEIAEMPGIYHNKDFDVVGTIVGLVEKSDIITGESICEGDVIIGFYSTGLHTNGYSLARKIIFEKMQLKINDYVREIDQTVAEALLSVHKSYYPLLKGFSTPEYIHGMAHITGGGLKGNIKRVIPKHLCAVIDYNSWETPALFNWMTDNGNVAFDDALSAFNMGIGFVVIAPMSKADEILKETGGVKIGEISKNDIGESVIINC